MRVVVNPDYEYLRPYLGTIPDAFSEIGEVIYKKRNEIRVVAYGKLVLNIKSFGNPFWFNRLIYSFLRKPKAQRAYEYALILSEKGISTPEPIAYIRMRTSGLIGRTFFISKQVTDASPMYRFGTEPVEGNEALIEAFARYTAFLHESGVYHKDYSPGNILYRIENGKPEFYIVDINRMRFGRVRIRKGCANFARLWGQQPFFRLIAKEYARSRNADTEQCTEWVLAYRKRFWKRLLRKRKPAFELDL